MPVLLLYLILEIIVVSYRVYTDFSIFFIIIKLLNINNILIKLNKHTSKKNVKRTNLLIV